MKRRLLACGMVFFGALALAGAGGRGGTTYANTSPTLTAMRTGNFDDRLREASGLIYDAVTGWVWSLIQDDVARDYIPTADHGGLLSRESASGVDETIFD